MQISILNILALLIGSGGIFAFIQFIIKRNDQKNYFEQILDDIEQYTQYCEKNPQFQNGRTKTACQCVNNEYIRLFKQHKLERRNQ